MIAKPSYCGKVEIGLGEILEKKSATAFMPPETGFR